MREVVTADHAAAKRKHGQILFAIQGGTLPPAFAAFPWCDILASGSCLPLPTREIMQIPQRDGGTGRVLAKASSLLYCLYSKAKDHTTPKNRNPTPPAKACRRQESHQLRGFEGLRWHHSCK